MTMNIMVPTTKHHEYMANEGMLYTPFENATPIEMKDICIFIRFVFRIYVVHLCSVSFLYLHDVLF